MSNYMKLIELVEDWDVDYDKQDEQELLLKTSSVKSVRIREGHTLITLDDGSCHYVKESMDEVSSQLIGA